MVKVLYEEKNIIKTFIIESNKTILDLSRIENIPIEGSCDGSMACSTCHIIVEKEYFEKLPDPSEEEEDMLDLAWGLTHTSRLGCQIIINDGLDGMKVKVPTGTRNMSV